jgi:uncharacterized membrane protein
MDYSILKFLHVGAMFIATSLAVGPSVMLWLIARNAEPAVIRRSFPFATTVFRAAGLAYGSGILFGAAAALTGAIDLTTRWLLAAYVLIALLIVSNLQFERWTHRAEDSIDDEARLASVVRERGPIVALASMLGLTLAIVFVMVVKPTL